MKISVSGTHAVGKSTLIEAFLSTHTDYQFEPEPYEVLTENYGEEFSSEPTAAEFYRQLEFCVQRLRERAHDTRVIFERCPIDFFAYLLALKELRRDHVDEALLQNAISLVTDAMGHLDIIFFLPLEPGANVSEEEDPKLRCEMDRQLRTLYEDSEWDARVVEARGSTSDRLKIVESVLLEKHSQPTA